MTVQQGIPELERGGRPGPVENAPLPGARDGDDGRLADGLGWFSLVLGGVQLAAPGALARAIGVQDTAENRALLRALGLREITTGLGILTRDRQAAWLWSRVAGDAMDLALLGAAFRAPESRSRSLAAATAAVAGVTALDVLAGKRRASEGVSRNIESLAKAITVNRPPAEVYDFWRDFENLPRFMRHLESVRAAEAGRSHWVAKGPGGIRLEWDAETTEDRRGETLAWRSLPGSDVENSGRVRFRPAPGGHGTEVRVDVSYRVPAGRIGAAVARLFGEHPEQQLRDDMRRFKQVMETGEIARSDASGGLLGMRPGRPGQTTPYTAFARGER